MIKFDPVINDSCTVVNETIIQVGGRRVISRSPIGYIKKGKFEYLVPFGFTYDDMILIANKTKEVSGNTPHT
ncbi:MAG TPA: hypothetical protein P5056_01330 [Candidatus Paceibacterota bacterium]|nr:hypothetical protein [Candidatus Paceibacterota bacterium]